ncbi:MAG: DUF4271 domain-containing protein [Pelobium sp.]
MKFLLFFLLLFICFDGFSQLNKDSLQLKKDTTVNPYRSRYIPDSATLARNNFVRDSITWHFLKPDPARPNPFIENLLKETIVTDPYLLTAPQNLKVKKNNYGLGQYISQKPFWFLPVILGILLFFGIVRIIFKNEIDVIFKAFYDDRILSQINKGENILISWQFLFLYLIFSLTVGLLICVILYGAKSSYLATDFKFFLLLSLFAFIFFGVKILILRFLAFMFELQKLVKEYLNIIYLSYFNSLFVLLPLTFCLVFINSQHSPLFITIGIVLFFAIIGFQFLRITIKILLNYRLSKFYLILYLCALEICPILIFATIINTSL